MCLFVACGQLVLSRGSVGLAGCVTAHSNVIRKPHVGAGVKLRVTSVETTTMVKPKNVIRLKAGRSCISIVGIKSTCPFWTAWCVLASRSYALVCLECDGEGYLCRLRRKSQHLHEPKAEMSWACKCSFMHLVQQKLFSYLQVAQGSWFTTLSLWGVGFAKPQAPTVHMDG